MTGVPINMKKIANDIIKQKIEESSQKGTTIKLYSVQDTIDRTIKNKLDEVKSADPEIVKLKEKEHPYSQSSVRRRMKDNNLIPLKGKQGEYVYAPLQTAFKTPKSTLLDVNDFLCYSLTPSCFTQQIAFSLNEEFSKKAFKAVALDDVLLCLYLNRDKIIWVSEADVNDIDDTEIEYHDYEASLTSTEIDSLLTRLINHYRHLSAE